MRTGPNGQGGLSEKKTELAVPQFVDAPSSHPRSVRMLNRVSRWLPRPKLGSADDWWSAARRGAPRDERARLAGQEPTPEAREALNALVQSLSSDMRFNAIGRLSAKSDTLRMARTHLRIHRALREDPAIADTPLPDPVFIIGWPRTGTTFLHHLLSQDPDNRTIPYWESFDPVPPASGPDRRIERLRGMLGQLERIAPRYQAIHPMEPDGAEECVALFMNELRSLQFDFQYRAPSYVRWLLDQDAGIAYDAYRRQLQLIQHHRPAGTRFVLKDPTHIVHLETLIDRFPGARFVFTHRDPAAALSSICSLTAYTRAIFSDDVDPRALGSEIWSGYWPRALERACTLRDQIPRDRQVDVRHADLARDPIQTAARLYEGLGLSFTDAASIAMKEFLTREQAGPARRHEHRLEGFGLRADEVRERFADYVERFDLVTAPDAREARA